MPTDYPRSRRVAEQLRRELSELIHGELKDPRLSGFITLTDVEVSPDFRHAKVYFTTMSSEAQSADALAGLRHAAGFLRSQVAQRIKLRVVPQLHFVYDESVERGVRLSHLIDAATADADGRDDGNDR